MKIIKLFFAAIILGGLVVVGFVYSGLYNVGASSPHSGLANWLMSTTMHASVDRRAKDIDVPNLDDEALQLAGINDFDSMCAACHGAPGRDPEAVGITPQMTIATVMKIKSPPARTRLKNKSPSIMVTTMTTREPLNKYTMPRRDLKRALFW